MQRGRRRRLAESNKLLRGMCLIGASRISRSVIAFAICEQMAQLSLITDVLAIEVLPGRTKKEKQSSLSFFNYLEVCSLS